MVNKKKKGQKTNKHETRNKTKSFTKSRKEHKRI